MTTRQVSEWTPQRQTWEKKKELLAGEGQTGTVENGQTRGKAMGSTVAVSRVNSIKRLKRTIQWEEKKKTSPAA